MFFQWFSQKSGTVALCAAVLGVFACTHLRAETPAAGSIIPNKATATWANPAAEGEASVESGTVQVTVGGQVGISLTEDHAISAEPGQAVVFAHVLHNSGNDATNIVLNLANLTGDSFNLANLRFYRDLNGNGTLEEGTDEVLTDGGGFNLVPNGVVTLLVAGEVPGNATAGTLGRVRITATVQNTEVSTNNTDTVTVTQPGALTLVKSVSAAVVQRNKEVTYTLRLNNSTRQMAYPRAVTIDGDLVQKVVLRDEIPRNTTFASFGTDRGQTAYHWYGDAFHTYRSTPPTDLTKVDAIIFAFEIVNTNASYVREFNVKANHNASGNFTNVAVLHYESQTEQNRGQLPGTPQQLPSNPVVTAVPGLEPVIKYYLRDDYAVEAVAAPLNEPVYVSADAAECNQFTTIVEQRTIIITSKLTGDSESYTSVETGPNTGIFHILPLVPTTNSTVSHPNNGVIESVSNDELTATLEGCGTTTAIAQLLIDPGGVVFNSLTGVPVAGAIVTLIDVSGFGNGNKPGQPADVLDFDGVTAAPSTVTTKADGRFQFPLVRPSTYKLAVVPPAGFSFPSLVAANLLPPNRTIDAQGSYGGFFQVTLATGAVFLDVPVDPAATGGLFVEKTASRTTAEVGDLVTYTVKVKNTTSSDVEDVGVGDALPIGFTYELGTFQINGKPAADPFGGKGPQLSFAIGKIPGAAVVTLTYRVRVGPNALFGSGVNTAVALGRGTLPSNVAMVTVQVQPGVFTDKAYIIGKVFVDDNTNGVQDLGEVGVPGVRFYLEDGTFVISDSEGKYSVYGLEPKTHVLKLDRTTIPKGAETEVLDPRNALDGGSRFVDLKRGELHKANFALKPTPAVKANVEARRKKGEVVVAELENGLRQNLTADGTRTEVGDPRGLPASGVVGGAAEQPAPNFTAVLPDNTLNGRNSSLPTAPVARSARIGLEEALTNITDNAIGFLDFKNGDTLASDQAAVRIKGAYGGELVLLVNGEKVPKTRLAKMVAKPETSLELREYLGINMQPGTNRLAALQMDPFGNERARQEIVLIAPSALGKIKISVSKKEFTADGVTPVKVQVKLTDEKGVAVSARTPLTLEASLGRWEVDDLNGREPGVQVFIEGGQAEFKLLPPAEPGDARIVISSGILKDQVTVPFLPDLRPLIASGLLEGTVNISKLGSSAIIPARSRDGFEEELRNFAVSGNNDRMRAAARAAFFLKGKIKGEYLLTAAYDSDKDTSGRLFRDIQPDEFYPVYGDASVRGFDAQSTGRLYVRIDKKKCYLLYGDFNTDTQTEARALGNYSRSVTGIKEHYEKKWISANLWASEDSTRQVVEEIRADGTSGPYSFKVANAVVNSEKIEIITRDRNQHSMVIKTVSKTRFEDYEFEPFTGRILFKAPVASLDSNLNPIYIRVTYEIDQGGPSFWVYGGDAQIKVHDRVEVGGAGVRDENPLLPYELYSGNTTVKLAKKTFLIGEVAQSDTAGTTGEAKRVEIRHEGEKFDARIYYGTTDATFTNANSQLSSGMTEGGAKVSYKVSDKTRLKGEAIWTENSNLGGDRKGVTASVEQTFPHNVRVELGLRHSEESAAPASTSSAGTTPNDVNSVRLRVTTPLPKLPLGTVYGEVENDVTDLDKRMVAVGMDYQLKNRGKLYARHEFINAVGSSYELNSFQEQNTTVVGYEADYMKDGQTFNEYRVKDAVDGKQAEASTGLRNQWHVGEGLRLNSSVERITAFEGKKDNESTALTGAAEYTANPDWKATGRLELRFGDLNNSYLNTLGYARKLSTDWTLLTKTILYLVKDNTAAKKDTTQARLQSGLAYRQTGVDKWSGLMKYEYKYEDGNPLTGVTTLRHAHILSLHGHYQPSKEWLFSAHYAGKYVTEQDATYDDNYHAHLLSGRSIYNINQRWDAGLNVSGFWSAQDGQFKYAAGPEIGFTIKKNLRLGFGYNFSGFRDDDLTYGDYTQQGFFVHLRFKFDEGLLNLMRKNDNE